MKKILLMRHAKSSWNNAALRDFDRPLNQRGNSDAPKMGLYLKELGIIPDQIFSSPANRAKSTVLKVIDQLGLDEKSITWNENLYFNGEFAYAEAIRGADNRSNVVMIVGHNPMTDEVISLLSNQPITRQITTAAIACLETDIESWKDLEYGTCQVNWIVTPKDIS